MASRYKFSNEEIKAIEQARKGNKDKRAEKVVDRLCDTICSLSNTVISSITGREWMIKVFN